MSEPIQYGRKPAKVTSKGKKPEKNMLPEKKKVSQKKKPILNKEKSMISFKKLEDGTHEVRVDITPKKDDSDCFKTVGIESPSIYLLQLKGLKVYVDDNYMMNPKLGTNTAVMDVLANVLEEECENTPLLISQLCRMYTVAPIMGGAVLAFSKGEEGMALKKRFRDHILNHSVVDNPYIALK
jgi:hypothetical protein